MEILEGFVRDDPEKVNVLYNLGMCYSELGNIDKSIGTLEKCVQLAPEQRRCARSTTRTQTGLGKEQSG